MNEPNSCQGEPDFPLRLQGKIQIEYPSSEKTASSNSTSGQTTKACRSCAGCFGISSPAVSIFMDNYHYGKCGCWGLSPLPRVPLNPSDGFQQAITSCAAKMEKGFKNSPGVTAGLPRMADPVSGLLPKWSLQDRGMSCPWGADGREAVRAGFH